ncbi:MAG: hypothetical protein H6726_17500 [Sandaracinaceae bacterium]|nr:hypothetical protein [Sandaracinaceae bacterium]
MSWRERLPRPLRPHAVAAPGPGALRALGATEDMYFRFDSVNPLYFGVVARFAGTYDDAAMGKAFAALQRRHPLLRAKIAMVGDTPWFVETDRPIPLERMDIAPGDEWRVLERSLVSAFDTGTGPLLRCVLYERGADDFGILFTYHHAIADGRSATFVIRDLLQSLAQQERGESPELPALPLMDYYGDRIHTLWTYSSLGHFTDTVSQTWNAAVRFMRRAGIPRGVPADPSIPLSKQSLLIEPRFVAPATMREVASRAKAESATIQCVLNAALTMAVAEVSPTRGLEATTCSQVIDLRERLVPPVGEDCGLFASGNTSMHRLGPNTRFWDLARDIRVGLQASIDTPLPFFHAATHESYASIARALGQDRQKAFSLILGSLHPEGLAVSNLGRVAVDVPGSPLRLTEFAFATNTNVLNSFNTSAVTYDGRMTWSFSASSAVGRETLANIADRSIALMQEALRT